MKIVKNLLVTFLLLGVAFEGASCVQTAHRSKKAKSEQIIRPNLSDLNAQMKVVKPFIDKPFLPQEVEKITDYNKKKYDESMMTKATLVGPTQARGGLEEKPTMYDTVVKSRPTVVMNPVPQPVSYGASKQVAGAFASEEQQHPEKSEMERMSPGGYSIPVQIGNGPSTGPTMAGYETPSFIHKGEKAVPSFGVHKQPHLSTPDHLKQEIEKDTNLFVSQFDNVNDSLDKSKILINGKKKLCQETKEISQEVNSELADLLKAKEVAIKLNNLLVNYEEKLSANQMGQLKLADEITFKELLRHKLIRESQGFRTNQDDFAELDHVNPTDIRKAVHEIKSKLASLN